MDSLSGLGRILIYVGLSVFALGCVLTLAGRLPYIGRLPGDFLFRKGNVTVYVPLLTSILLSLLLTFLLWLFRR